MIQNLISKRLLQFNMKKINQNKFPIVAIVAMTKNFVIGDGHKMLWHLPNDLKRLKKMTIGNPLIMGRKTHESIGKILQGRANIILSRNAPKIENKNLKFIANNFDESISTANKWINDNFEKKMHVNKCIFIFGGGEIYKLAIDYCIRIELTLIDLLPKNGVVFPKIKQEDWTKTLIKKVKVTRKSIF